VPASARLRSESCGGEDHGCSGGGGGGETVFYGELGDESINLIEYFE